MRDTGVKKKMEIQEILKALERYTRVFPREAIEEAVRRRQEITPELLRVLEHTIENAESLARDDEDGSYFAYVYAMYLLAQFRETGAYPLVVQFARLPGDTLDSLMSDFITDGLDCVLASVCGGDTALIETLIEDPNADEYARSAGIHALMVLVAAGDRTRDEVMAYFKELFDGRLERLPSNAWNSLVSCATDLYPDELYGRIVRAYEDDLPESGYMSLEEVDEVLALDRQTVLDRLPKGAPVYIQDVIEEMEWWACFNPPKRPKKPKGAKIPERKREQYDSLFLKAVHPNPPKFLWPSIFSPEVKPASWQPEIAASNEPVRSPKTQPNDRCPCGSGKKFKKCCGRLDSPPAIIGTVPVDATKRDKTPLFNESAGTYTIRGGLDALDPRRDSEYIIGKAQNGVACAVAHNPLVYFSTETGDAWLLDMDDHLALCLARGGERLPFRIMETAETFNIEWNADFQIDGDTFTVFDRSGPEKSIFGYPIEMIKNAIRAARF